MIPRLIASKFKELATQYPAITITGPRQSGKSTLCKLLFKDHTYISLEEIDQRQFATEDPRGFLNQFKGQPLILDEIQRTPDLPSYLQSRIDTNPDQTGHYILTGSQQFEMVNSVNQSLAGRTAVLKLLPLAYDEITFVNKAIDLNGLLYKGGYPRIYDKNLNPTEALAFYLNTYVERDIRQIKHINNLAIFEKFLKLCASNVGQLINYSRLANDCGVDYKTIQSWLSVLQASYIVYELNPHHENFRKRLTKSPKLYFYDTGLACYLLGIQNTKQLNSHPLKGQLFENFIVIEFLKNCYNHGKQNNLYFYRDHSGNEVDLIIDNGNELTTVEIKSSQTLSNSSFKGLKHYHKIAGDRNAHRILIYTGDRNLTIHDSHVYNYCDIAKAFKLIEQSE
ncbi:MAG: ATP-binding protein [Coxiellaceae bacterium]|nr:ATP-binding protein [Coxiellaceae bacterium]